MNKIRETPKAIKWLTIFLKYGVLIGAVLITTFPIIWVMMSSFKTNAEIFSEQFLPSKITFDGYKAALAMAPLPKFFVNSLVTSITAMLINVTFVSMAAYIFARIRFRGSGLLYGVLMLSMVLPATAIIQPVYMQINRLGLLDTTAGLIIVYSCLGVPITLMVMRAFFAGIPRDMEESASVDGASFIRTYIQIILPIAKPGIATCMVLRFLEYWNEFTYALVLTTSTDVRTLPLALSYFVSTFSFDYMAMFAAITIAAVPSLVVFAIFNEQVVSSMTVGAVKG